MINEFQNFVYKFWSLHLALSDKTTEWKSVKKWGRRSNFCYFWNKFAFFVISNKFVLNPPPSPIIWNNQNQNRLRNDEEEAFWKLWTDGRTDDGRHTMAYHRALRARWAKNTTLIYKSDFLGRERATKKFFCFLFLTPNMQTIWQTLN